MREYSSVVLEHKASIKCNAKPGQLSADLVRLVLSRGKQRGGRLLHGCKITARLSDFKPDGCTSPTQLVTRSYGKRCRGSFAITNRTDYPFDAGGIFDETR